MDLNDKSRTICRICLQANDEELEWIFKSICTTGELVKISEMLMSFAAVNVSLGDGLPEQICVNCTRETIKTYTFKRRCEESDKFFRDHLGAFPTLMPIDKIEINEEDVIDKIIKSEITEDFSVDEYDLIESCDQQSEVKFALEQDNFTPKILLISKPETNDRIKPTEEKIDSLIQTRRRRGLQIQESGESSIKNNVATSSLAKKRKHVHSGKKSNQCKVCNKTYASPTATIAHERIHTGEKPYECGICKSKFVRSFDLILHTRIHTGERPYECDFCERKFKQSNALVKHRRTHTGEKPFECDVCAKTFSQSSTLVVHKRVHTGEKPFECDVCKVKFADSSHLVRHKRRKHSGKGA